ncbi:hypothetical protein BDR22DRAFT_818479 [Usnea florida]
MQPCVKPGCSRLMASLAVLLSALSLVLALPTVPLPLNTSLLEQNSSSLLAPSYGRPPESPTCPSGPEWGITTGRPSYDDCDYVLTNLYPRDPLARPVLRNFYVKPSDVSHTMSNFRLPYEQSYRSCSIQILLATDFNNVPHDNATWNEIRGATRTIFRACILGKGVGGVVPRNGMLKYPKICRTIEKTGDLTSSLGEQGNIEIVVYGQNSVFAKNQILKYSQDPLARSIAVQELLELMKMVTDPDAQSTGVEIGSMATQAANATVADANVATS